MVVSYLNMNQYANEVMREIYKTNREMALYQFMKELSKIACIKPYCDLFQDKRPVVTTRIEHNKLKAMAECKFKQVW